jgi:catechol 2,3-dioxygenase-like lactoylglutathione lyase family enzyme
MAEIGGFDHIAIAVPDLAQQVERFTKLLGMVVQNQSERYALIADPTSGFKIELNQSADGQAHFRHLGFRASDVDAAHGELLAAGMTSVEDPHRRDFARMYTSFLKEANGLEVQLVSYD